MEIRGKKLGEIGEKRIIREIISKYISKPSWDEHLGLLDDARDFLPIAPRILFSIDGYSLEKAMLPWRNYRDIGWCIVVGGISDHIVKGGIPREIMVSIGLPSDTLVDDLVELFNGIREAVEQYNLRLLGGDLNESKTPWISVSVISYTSAKKPPSRCCGSPGDKVVVTGYYGAMGYVVLHGLEEASGKGWVVKYTRRPIVYLETAIIIASNYRVIHSSMDVSDGLGSTLLELIRVSGKGIVLEDKPFYYNELDEECGSDEECLWRHILNGGEEYGSVLIIDRNYVDRNCFHGLIDHVYT
ncbi:MAG: thiamine-monophosphate kinase [Desulfurococcales archaeon ex4484_58]|nr:MAG: thiamine-monophosphate kinase [Desulfurococcales archaeon ex4484_58]